MTNVGRRWALLTTSAMLALVSCSDSRFNEHASGREELAPSSQVATPGEKSTLTPELRAATIAATQRDAGEIYHAALEPTGSARFVHLAQGFEATIDSDEVRVAALSGSSWEMTMSMAGVGCEGQEKPTLATGLDVVTNRVEVTRDNVNEWYVNGPMGLEQGFTLFQAPACAGIKTVVLDVGGNLMPELHDEDSDGHGQTISFLDGDGAEMLRYSDLFVTDALGKHLPSWMSVSGGAIALHVDDAGATYPIQIDPLVWVEQQKLVASDGTAGDQFGVSVSVSGDTALVGSWGSDVGTNMDQGSVYVFVRNGTTWTEQAKLTASDVMPGEQFARTVAVSGDTALVGAHLATVGANFTQGSVYVFVRNGTTWTQQQKLTASDGMGGDEFGVSIAVFGDTALVGSWDDTGANFYQGSAYVFVRNGVTWTQQQKLTASDGAEGDRFGWSVSISADTALVGAWWANIEQGSAYVFVRKGTTWNQEAKLVASDGAMFERFGSSVSVSGDTALVGAESSVIGVNSEQGSAYVFVRNGTTWTQQQKLTASDGAATDFFGSEVSVSGNTALVAGSYNDVGTNTDQGSAYVFVRNGTTWTQQQKLTASDGAAGDRFGRRLSLSGDTALVGAIYDNVGANGLQGSAYVFVLRKNSGDACASAAECVSGFCVDGVCCDSVCGNGDATDCQACSMATGAAVDGTCSTAAVGTQCRASAGECDVAESCDGAANDCPPDANSPDGTTCPDGVCSSGVCKGAGGAGGMGGTGGTGGTGESSSSSSGGNPPSNEGGCACRAASSQPTSFGALTLLGVALLIARRRLAR